MFRRESWLDRLDLAWQKVPIVWLTGVRRIGKTTLARQLAGTLFLNCDRPSMAQAVADPERFLAAVRESVVVFDEIHQLPDPSLILKIAADEFPELRVLATGSATLAATRKFSDSLTGRKRTVHLLPVLHRELEAFGGTSLEKRLLHGGLPEALLDEEKDPERYAEWLDSYFARDVQELFGVDNRQAFLRLTEILLRNSGGLLTISRLATQSGVTRPTVYSYLEALETTHVILPVRPFHGGGRQEILRQPKVYGFDTGFVSFYRGWDELRPEDAGVLWEHLVLETLLSQGSRVRYWRDKQKREVDFVLPQPRGRVDAIETKWNANRFSPKSLRAFRKLHPAGANFVISPQLGEPYPRRIDDLDVIFCSLTDWEAGTASKLATLVAT